MITNTIISSLIFNDEFTRKTLPYIKKEYFEDIGEQVVFALIQEFYGKYNKTPSLQSLKIEVDSKNLNESVYESTVEVLNGLSEPMVDTDWLIDTTEDFCKTRAYFNAIVAASELIDKGDTALYGQTLDIVTKALAVTFDSSIGHDFIEDAQERYEAYREKKDQLKCGIPVFDHVTKGGFVNQSLTVFMAPTGVGKSLFLCNFAAQFLKQGKNVLYLTMEMSETQVSQRIDLNLLDMTTEELVQATKAGYINRINNIKRMTSGKIIVKEYPSGSAHSGHFRYLIADLKLKKDFVPDVIVVDYLNICASARVTKAHGMFEFSKNIAEELRGLGQEFKCRVFTATQVNRDGAKVSDFDLTNTSESFGVPATADYFYGIIETEELATMGQMKIKRLKDRYQDYVSWWPSFIIGVDKSKQRIYDINAEQFETIVAEKETTYEVDDIPSEAAPLKSSNKFDSLINI